MAAYRLYVLNPNDIVAETMEHEFASDAEALARAEALLRDDYAVEVWTGPRLVGRVGGDFRIA